MGDPHRANRRLTGYGPTRLPCDVLTVFKTVVASFLSLLVPVMTVFVVASFVAGICDACFAPFGPCVVHDDGYVPSCSFAFRNAASVTSIQNSPAAVGLCASAYRHRALRLSSPFFASCSPHPHHLEGGGRTISAVPPIWGCGRGNPTQFVVGRNDTVGSAGVAPVGVVGDAPKSCDGLPVQSCGPVSLHVPNPGSPNPGSPNIGPVWSPNFWTGPESKFLDRSVSRLFSSRSGSASSWLRGVGGASPRALSGCRSPRG